eukprot:1045031-Prorocentrum_lima.AAC.1
MNTAKHGLSQNHRSVYLVGIMLESSHVGAHAPGSLGKTFRGRFGARHRKLPSQPPLQTQS